MNEEDDGRLASALEPDLISSEESGEEEVDTLQVHPLPWRKGEVTEFFQRLDQRWEAGLSPIQRRQLVCR